MNSGPYAFVTFGDRRFQAAVPEGRGQTVTLSATDLSGARHAVLWTTELDVQHTVEAVRLARQSEGVCVEVDAKVAAGGRSQTLVWVFRDNGECVWQE